MIIEKIKVDDKYEIEIGGTPYVNVKRYGYDWRDCTGDGLIMAMAYRIQELEEKESE
jgi:hypothetical protein